MQLININVILTQSLISDDLTLKDKNIVIIDALRATSTMTIALINGAKEVIPADTVSNAARIAKGAGNAMLCGERNGKIIEGFHLGNSPLEYSEEAIKGKPLVFTTTNGTNSIVKSRLAKSVVLGSYINLSAIVDYLAELKEDFIIICSGKLNNFCLEDAVCAGLIIKGLLERSKGYVCNDAENACLVLAEMLAVENGKPSKEKVFEMMKHSEHGKYLLSLGFEEDLKVCSGIDTYSILPIYKNNVIKLKEQFESEDSQKQQMKKINIGKVEPNEIGKSEPNGNVTK